MPGGEEVEAEADADAEAVHLAYLTPAHKRKGKGGRQPAADPRLDPGIDPKRARRILANRLSAARSKMKQKSHVEVRCCPPTFASDASLTLLVSPEKFNAAGSPFMRLTCVLLLLIALPLDSLPAAQSGPVMALAQTLRRKVEVLTYHKSNLEGRDRQAARGLRAPRSPTTAPSAPSLTCVRAPPPQQHTPLFQTDAS